VCERGLAVAAPVTVAKTLEGNPPIVNATTKITIVDNKKLYLKNRFTKNLNPLPVRRFLTFAKNTWIQRN
jgi:hypothetical protein